MYLTNFRKRKSHRHSLESRRKQRIARNKRKREEKKLLKRGLTTSIQDLKKENESLIRKFSVESAIKEKYFEMWRASEKEKDKIKTAKLVLNGCRQNVATKSKGILNIDPSLLEDVDNASHELGKGRFGTVLLKKFRSSPVAVKYFDTSVRAQLVEREAYLLTHCCHINLPLIYGMNNILKPFFIVTQFYGSESLKPVTLRGLVREEAEVTKLAFEDWLHIVTQLSDCLSYLHNTSKIIHNDIKGDNVVIVCSSTTFFSPILIDFGKACFLNDAKKKILSDEEKDRYHKEHFHIAPEVIEGTCAQSILSDVYSFGVVIASIYSHTKYRPLKELAKHCLKPVSNRCTSTELLGIVLNCLHVENVS